VRHRLLREAGGFEGLLSVAVDVDPHDFSVAQREGALRVRLVVPCKFTTKGVQSLKAF